MYLELEEEETWRAGKSSVVVLNLEVWERPTHTTFNKCRKLILLSFLPPKIWGEREVWERRSHAFPLHYTPVWNIFDTWPGLE